MLARPVPVFAEAGVLLMGATRLSWWKFLAAVGLSNLGIAAAYAALGEQVQLPILRLAGERDHLPVVADQYGAPTSAALLADVTAQVLRQKQREGEDGFPFGLYHLVAGGETNWCDYARYILSEALAAGWSLKLLPDAIQPIPTSDYPTPAKRPANSRLDTGKSRRTFDMELPDWKNGVGHVLQQILADGESQVASGKSQVASSKRYTT